MVLWLHQAGCVLGLSEKPREVRRVTRHAKRGVNWVDSSEAGVTAERGHLPLAKTPSEEDLGGRRYIPSGCAGAIRLLEHDAETASYAPMIGLIVALSTY